MPNIGEWYSDGHRHYQVIRHVNEAIATTHVRLRARYTNERFTVPLERFRNMLGPVTGVGDYVP